jgi:hypothetical protein
MKGYILKQGRYFTLLELIIAMSLTILVLTVLTFFYQQVSLTGTQLDKLQKESFQMRFLENRLSHVLQRAVPESEKDFVFMSVPAELGLTKSPSLMLTFDNGVDIDKSFANHVLGRIYIDSRNRLMLAYWPSPSRWNGNPAPPMKKEVLMDGVEEVSFEFFIAPDKTGETAPPKEGEKILEPTPKGGWRIEPWSAEFKQLPAIVRMTLTLANTKEKIEFVIPLPNTKKPIFYDQ